MAPPSAGQHLSNASSLVEAHSSVVPCVQAHVSCPSRSQLQSTLFILISMLHSLASGGLLNFLSCRAADAAVPSNGIRKQGPPKSTNL